MRNIIAATVVLITLLTGIDPAEACTSMIVGAERSASGRPLLWKHRDTDAENNFLARVEPTDSTAGYVGLFNEGDSLFAEAWMGMNDRGFAIMNTASYNLPDFESQLTDREAAVMTEALKRCTTVDDFARLLELLPHPLGVQANFGVIDGMGGAAYFETSDSGWNRFDVADSADGYLIRTNFSMSGTEGEGKGYIRFAAAQHMVADIDLFSPADFTENLSRSFYHPVFGRDMAGDSIVVNTDFIPRDITRASLVVEGVTHGMKPEEIRMWGNLGYSPCAVSEWITLTDIPAGFSASADNLRSQACEESVEALRQAIPVGFADAERYIEMSRLIPIVTESRKKSMENFHNKVPKP